MSAKFRREWLYGLAAPVLLLLSPLVVFLKHNEYGIQRAESLFALGLFLVVGLLLGLIMLLGRTPARVVILALLATHILDMQMVGLKPLLALATALAVSILTWILRRHALRLATVIGAVMLLTSLFMPGGRLIVRHESPATGSPARSDLPLVLHLIMDEHIGIEGIPAEFDPDAKLAASMRDFFVDNGFEVYGRAYSRYFHTEESVSNLVNFDASAEPSRYFNGPFAAGATLRENAWLQALSERGYRLYVVQPDFVRYIDTPTGDAEQTGLTVVDYTLETIASIENAPLAIVEKTRFIVAIYMRLCDAGSWATRRYMNLRARLHAHGITLPVWRDAYTRTSSLATRDLLARMREDLRAAGPGQMFLAHLMLPHCPYAFRADGSLNPRGSEWRFSYDRTKSPRRNDAGSRETAYAQYLDQVQATRDELARTFGALRESGQWDNAVIVVHGDHGSRLTLDWPTAAFRDSLSDADLVDGFSTLFAVKRPGRPGRYDRRQLPIDHLFTRILRDGEEPGDPRLESAPFVLLANRGSPMTPRPMPLFGRDLSPRND